MALRGQRFPGANWSASVFASLRPGSEADETQRCLGVVNAVNDPGDGLAALADEDDEFVLTRGDAVVMGGPGWSTIDAAASEGLRTCGVEDATEGRTGPLRPISVVRARGPDMNRQL